MTLGFLVSIIGGIALALTLLIGIVLREQKNWLMTYAQSFVGALFIFSGFVKAMDPLGTAYKMEQYFAEFESTFSETWFSFIAPLFPALSEASITFSVVMIVFEIVLGLMILIGSSPRFSSWAFFLLVAFFTFLTGFTYLTGYVPNGVNFFEFGQWAAFEETNMKVTDCGCFGDFLKLKPKTSFFKDVFLLIPAIFFLLRTQDMHQLFSAGTRRILNIVTLVGITIYCFSNYVWDIPHTDFRPFKAGANIAEKKTAEEEAVINVKNTYVITDLSNGEKIRLDEATYLRDYTKYKGDNFEMNVEKEEPAIPTTKISDFEIVDLDGNDVTENILTKEGYHFMVVAYKIPYASSKSSTTVQDTLFLLDTVQVEGFADSVQYVKRVGEIKDRTVSSETFTFPEKYTKRYEEVLNPVLQAAEAAGVPAYTATGYTDPAMIDEFRHATQSAYPFYVADDILLKTIVRSNPGVVLWKNGEIVQKWHINKLPTFGEIQQQYLK